MRKLYLIITTLLINSVPTLVYAEQPPAIVISDEALEHHNKMILHYESYMLSKYGQILKISAIAEACGHKDTAISIVRFESEEDAKELFDFNNGMISINQGVIVGETIMRQLLAYRGGLSEAMSDAFKYSAETESTICKSTMKMIKNKKLVR